MGITASPSADGFSPAWWDSNEAALLYFRVGDPRQSMLPAERMRLRISLFEVAAASNACDQVVEVRREFLRRVAALTGHKVGAWGAKPRGSSVATAIVMIVVGAVSAIPAFRTGNVGVLSISIALVLGAAILTYSRRRPWLSAIKRKRCVSCGFDLSATLPGYVAEQELVAEIGPRCCTECGAAWPLVPAALESQ